jgi:molybdate transport system regulatory protein
MALAQTASSIRDFGSISAAGRAMDMSCKRAWDLVEEINRICGHAAVARQTGGKNGGGAMLTPFGTSLVARYRKIERDAARAVRKELEALRTDMVARANPDPLPGRQDHRDEALATDHVRDINEGARLPAHVICSEGSRPAPARLRNAAARVAEALEAGADLLIINRLGKRERDGKGLSYLIQRALGSDIPVVIAVSQHRFDDWMKFVGGMTAKLPCDRDALDAWWQKLSASKRPGSPLPNPVQPSARDQ